MSAPAAHGRPRACTGWQRLLGTSARSFSARLQTTVAHPSTVAGRLPRSLLSAARSPGTSLLSDGHLGSSCLCQLDLAFTQRTPTRAGQAGWAQSRPLPGAPEPTPQEPSQRPFPPAPSQSIIPARAPDTYLSLPTPASTQRGAVQCSRRGGTARGHKHPVGHSSMRGASRPRASLLVPQPEPRSRTSLWGNGALGNQELLTASNALELRTWPFSGQKKDATEIVMS